MERCPDTKPARMSTSMCTPHFDGSSGVSVRMCENVGGEPAVFGQMWQSHTGEIGSAMARWMESKAQWRT